MTVNVNYMEIDQMAERFGGRYKLTVLIQKRLKELVKGAQKLVELEDRNLINVVFEEIRQGKIVLEGMDLPSAPKEEEGKKKSRKKDKE
jgi:DNA-directed RNA polymerase subunit omega